jgi:hypothetical protein
MKIMKGVGAIALATATVATTALADDRGYSAALCATSASNVLFSSLGVEVTNLSSANVFCGAAPIVGSDVYRIEATVYDRNPSADLCCTMSVINAQGFTIASGSRCSAGNSNASQLLSVVPPPNAAGTVLLVCNIPAVQPTGASRIATYRVSSTP